MRVQHCPDSGPSFRFLDGCSLSFDECLSRYERFVYAAALNLLGSAAEAEEVLVRVFLSIWDDIDGQVSENNFRKTLMKETLLQAAEFLESRSYAVLQLSICREEENSLEDLQTFSERSMLSHLQKLPFEYRKVFVLRDSACFSLSEISEVLSISLEDVRARLRRARLMLRRSLVRDWVSLQAIRQISAAVQAEDMPQLLL